MKWTISLLSAGLFALAASAFDVTSVPEEIPEVGRFTRTRVSEGKTTFSFIAPNGWFPSSDAAAKRISLSARTPEATITIHMSTNAVPASPAKLKERIASETSAYKDVNVIEEFGASCGSGPGQGIDFRHLVSDKFTMNTRLAVFPAPEGSMEVSISSQTEKIENLHNIWTGFINSFRVEEKK